MFNLGKKNKKEEISGNKQEEVEIKKTSPVIEDAIETPELKEEVEKISPEKKEKEITEESSLLEKKDIPLLNKEKPSLLKKDKSLDTSEKIENKKENESDEKPTKELTSKEKKEEEKKKKEEAKKRKEEEKKKKKEIVLENITSYKEAIKAINFFEATEQWEKAYKAIEEVKIKEKEAFDEIVTELKGSDNINSSEGLKQTKVFEEKIKGLNKRKEKIEKDEEEFRKKEEAKRFKVSFKQIKSKINLLIKTNNNSDAMNLLSAFLEDHKEKNIVINFYNTQRKKILKNVEKERKREEAKMGKNAKVEAYNLVGEVFEEVQENTNEKNKNKNKGFFSKIKEKLNFYNRVKENLKKKRLLDEVTLLIDEDDKIKKQLAKEKLQNMHKGLIKEIYNDNLEGFDLYGKILGADKISGDTFGLKEGKEQYTFFIGDATGHGIRAGFIVTLLSRTFEKFVDKVSLKTLTFEINNTLKQNLKNKNFITGIIFQTKKKNLNKITIAGMGHEPLIIFRDKTKTTERLIPGGLAAGIRLMTNEDSIKEKDIELEDNDIIFTYSDGITEARNENGEMYSLERLEVVIHKIASVYKEPRKIYEQIIEDLKIFQGGTHFSDDASIIVIKRNKKKDIVKKGNSYLDEISEKQNLDKKDLKKLEGKNKTEIDLELEKIKKEKDLKSIVKSLDNLYITGEILKLKQESIRFIKKGYIDKRINAYLKKAIDNETKYKIDLKNQRISNKYTVLTQLLKKGDYDTVIRESSEIISKEGVI